ncbi:cytochrome c oxidase assembly protein [Kordiimonas sp.]|uniref:cytochrome c oxidase assembly protein n=1 Tax=Kordiimonas sp. TaxID=1970157 RepID=UPI003A90EF21
MAENKNGRMALTIAGVAVGMVGMAYAAVPLYNLFCKVTGYGGTTQKVDVGSDVVIDREMKVRFNAAVHRDMPWNFKPVQISQKMHIGEQKLAYFEAYNPTDKTIVGTATYNVTPHKAGEYFAKIDCFCFTEQELKPGERISMPVVYFIDPLIDEDRNLDEVSEVTLSYTFFVKDVEDAETTVGR